MNSVCDVINQPDHNFFFFNVLFKSQSLELWEACSDGDLSKVQQLVKQGRNINWAHPREVRKY